jgi:predicted amidohydrolase
MGPSCVVAPSGKFLARLDVGEGIAIGKVDIAASELDRWKAIATYRADRRPDLYR